jgi:ABC-type Zn uptake system ZnuABC Zn-binding protein ZnuA
MPISSSGQPTRHILAVLGILALLLAALTAPPEPAAAQDDDPIKVVATFSILADWIQNVGGEHIEITTIVPAGGDAHTFDPNPEQVASIAEADVIFEIGLGFESWLDDMYDASGSSATRIVVSEGVELLSIDDGHDEEHEGEEHAEEGHEHGEHDPHIWGDVSNAIQAVESIRSHLSDVDPDNAADYDANAAAYTSELDELDTWIATGTQAIPEDQRKLVTTHDTFGYYAHAYDFQVVGTALSSLSTEGGDPPANEIAELVEHIQAENVPAIFAENISNNDLMQVIADEAGVTLAPPLYTDALGESGTDGDTYIAMMTYNTNTIVTALTGD